MTDKRTKKKGRLTEQQQLDDAQTHALLLFDLLLYAAIAVFALLLVLAGALAHGSTRRTVPAA